MEIKDIKNGEYFTLKEIKEPKENQIWIKLGYDRSTDKIIIYRFSDINDSRSINKHKEVYTDFIF